MLKDKIYDALTGFGAASPVEAYAATTNIRNTVGDGPSTYLANVIRQTLAPFNDGIPPEGTDAELIAAFEEVEQDIFEGKEAAQLKNY